MRLLDCVPRIDDERRRRNKRLVVDGAMICQDGNTVDRSQPRAGQRQRYEIVLAQPSIARQVRDERIRIGQPGARLV